MKATYMLFFCYCIRVSCISIVLPPSVRSHQAPVPGLSVQQVPGSHFVSMASGPQRHHRECHYPQGGDPRSKVVLGPTEGLFLTVHEWKCPSNLITWLVQKDPVTSVPFCEQNGDPDASDS